MAHRGARAWHDCSYLWNGYPGSSRELDSSRLIVGKKRWLRNDFSDSVRGKISKNFKCHHCGRIFLTLAWVLREDSRKEKCLRLFISYLLEHCGCSHKALVALICSVSVYEPLRHISS